METQTRNCFISYHHERDQEFFSQFREISDGLNISDHSLHSDISYLAEESIYRTVRDKMRNCSITVVLVGEKTGHRKWIDWEIWASLRAYTHPTEPQKSFKPNGLLAIFLPSRSHSVPNRLRDNIHSGYAACIKWDHLEKDLGHAIQHAYLNRTDHLHRIDNSRKRQSKNSLDLLGLKI